MKRLLLVAIVLGTSCIALASNNLRGSQAYAGQEEDARLHQQYQEAVEQAKAAQEKQIAEVNAQMEQQQAVLDRGAKILDEQQALMDEQRALSDRMVADQKRYENILSTWERQQEQYQNYLDALRDTEQ